MTSSDLSGWIQAIAALGMLVVAVIGQWHLTGRTIRQLRVSTVSSVVLVALAWAPSVRDSIRSYYSPNVDSALTESLPEGAARLEVNHKVKADDYVNLYTINRGQSVILSHEWRGFLLVPENNIPSQTLTSIYSQLRTMLSFDHLTEAEIAPGVSSVWFSVSPFLLSFNLSKEDWLSSRPIYVVALMRYKDKTTPLNHSLYSEVCSYYQSGVEHACDGGHQRIYMQKDLPPS